MKLWRTVIAAFVPALCAGGVVVGMCYVLKLLIQASPPEIGAGIIGGIIWSFFFAKAWQLFNWTLQDAESTIKDATSVPRENDTKP